MNPMFRMGMIFALIVTACKVIAAFAVLPAVGFVAANSSFFYGLSAGVIVAGLTRNLWFILIAIALVFVVLTGAGF